ncbi:MAG: dTDP-4-dehydrorhamnose 3,5-epimerase [Gemmatimonadales bacterium]
MSETRTEPKTAGQLRFVESPLRGAWTIDPIPHRDERGWFLRAWCAEEFQAHGITFDPVQANMGFSAVAGTIRGLHYQEAPHLEAKLVRCTRGAVFDVVVDLRPDSQTFGRWFATDLTAENARALFVPPQCAHGYQTLADGSEVYYETSASYAPHAVRGIRFDDPAMGIRWPLPVTVVSRQDRNWPLLPVHRRSDSL